MLGNYCEMLLSDLCVSSTLDVGSGGDTELRRYCKQSTEDVTVCCDINRAVFRNDEQTQGVIIVANCFQLNILKEKQFDLIVASDVIEHFIKEDGYKLIRKSF